MKLKVKKIWEGKVAIREKYLDQLRQKREDLIIYVGNQRMHIPFVSLEKKILEISHEVFFDRFTGQSHHLVYFAWDPDKTLF